MGLNEPMVNAAFLDVAKMPLMHIISWTEAFGLMVDTTYQTVLLYAVNITLIVRKVCTLQLS
jgi:hypothetical protein